MRFSVGQEKEKLQSLGRNKWHDPTTLSHKKGQFVITEFGKARTGFVADRNFFFNGARF
jgi:hypothetical protein